MIEIFTIFTQMSHITYWALGRVMGQSQVGALLGRCLANRCFSTYDLVAQSYQGRSVSVKPIEALFEGWETVT